MPGTSPAPDQRATSYGRGGAGKSNFFSIVFDMTYLLAGNIQSEKPASTLDMETPAIKSDVYTTGRGGQGNMTKNDWQNPARARESQDMEAPARRYSQSDSHYGRGGVGNTETMTSEKIVVNTEAADALTDRETKEKEVREPSTQVDMKAVAETGRALLRGKR
ncbi:hypothetical protein MMC11_003528 [Xylographa trunciseda]|nr:hypothetical protein [Xylographa trunciseda]